MTRMSGLEVRAYLFEQVFTSIVRFDMAIDVLNNSYMLVFVIGLQNLITSQSNSFCMPMVLGLNTATPFDISTGWIPL